MIKKPNKDKILKLASEHWAWIEEVLANRQTETRHMFIEGFKHGYKHGFQDGQKEDK